MGSNNSFLYLSRVLVAIIHRAPDPYGVLLLGVDELNVGGVDRLHLGGGHIILRVILDMGGGLSVIACMIKSELLVKLLFFTDIFQSI